MLEERTDLTDAQRAALLALLKRGENVAPDGQQQDNPPISLIFDRHQAEKKLPRQDGGRVGDGAAKFTAAVGDLPVRSINASHIRQ